MKKLIPSLIAALLAIAVHGQPSPKPLNLSGTVKDVSSGTIYLQRYDNKSFFTIDSATIVNGTFSFNSQVLLPEIYGLSLIGSGESPFDSFIVFLDETQINVDLDTAHEFRNTVVKGSKEQDLLAQFRARRGVPIQDILKEHPASLAALYYLYRYHSFRLTPTELRASIDLIDPSFEHSAYVAVLRNLADVIEGISVGNKAPDFSAQTVDGTAVRLSDYLGSGYVLIDFWASWCPPCRAENPHLVKCYDAYRNSGFEIVGISLDSRNEPWVKAIAQDGLPWTQLIDRAAWAGEGVKTYGVRLIPANFLLDKDGVIVAKNLKGEKLDETLARLLGDKNH